MKLAITTIQKNRGPWIKQWIAFHYLVGFRHFYVYIHDSSDDTKEVLEKLQKKLDIKIFPVDPKIEKPQLICYQESYRKFGDEVDWMAFLDGDEFLFPTAKSQMAEVLAEFQDKGISAIGVYWAIFGSSGHVEEPKGLIIENFTRRAGPGYPNNRHIKSIIKGSQDTKVGPADPHFFQTPKGTFDENLRLITSGWTNYEPTYNKLQINHYLTQSRTYFLNRKYGTRGPDGGDIRDDAWWVEHDRNEIEDLSMQRFIAPLKELLSEI